MGQLKNILPLTQSTGKQLKPKNCMWISDVFGLLFSIDNLSTSSIVNTNYQYNRHGQKNYPHYILLGDLFCSLTSSLLFEIFIFPVFTDILKYLQFMRRSYGATHWDSFTQDWSWQDQVQCMSDQIKDRSQKCLQHWRVDLDLDHNPEWSLLGHAFNWDWG